MQHDILMEMSDGNPIIGSHGWQGFRGQESGVRGQMSGVRGQESGVRV